MIALLGLQKYFNVALVVLLLLLGAAAFTYRASYLHETERRANVEAALAQTTAAFDEHVKSTKAAMAAITKAADATRSIAEGARSQREKALKATNDQDGPVAPVLRDALRVR